VAHYRVVEGPCADGFGVGPTASHPFLGACVERKDQIERGQGLSFHLTNRGIRHPGKNVRQQIVRARRRSFVVIDL
jgi:hypothetical protein